MDLIVYFIFKFPLFMVWFFKVTSVKAIKNNVAPPLPPPNKKKLMLTIEPRMDNEC